MSFTIYTNEVTKALSGITYSIYLVHPLFLNFGFMQIIPSSNRWIRGMVLIFSVSMGAFILDSAVKKIVNLISDSLRNNGNYMP